MARHLPPLNAVKAFEAAARHLSFTEAAAELNVTQAAVSHQVKALEEWLGVQLFRRGNRQIFLTDTGQTYLPTLRDALDRIAAATASVTEKGQAGPLRITVLQSLAAKWLLPRLPDFQARHPDIDVLLSTTNRLIDLYREDFHLALRFTSGERARRSGLEVHHLMDEAIFPVCAPALLRGDRPLRTPNDIADQTLLRDETYDTAEDPGWRTWCAAAGIAPPQGHGPGFSDSALVVQAAIAGQGIALTRLSLVREDLNAGRLVCPFGPILRTRFAYWALTTPERGRDRRVRALINWLQDQARAQRNDPLLVEAIDPPVLSSPSSSRIDWV